MICPKCGAQNMDGVTFCGSCGAQLTSFTPPAPVVSQPADNYNQQQPYQQPQQPQPQQPYYGSQMNVGVTGGALTPPKNYMTEAIIVTVVSFLCCSSLISLILGIIAIVKANNVNTEFAKGNFTEANRNAVAAKKLTIWAAVVAVLFVILIVILIFTVIGIAGLSELGDIFQNM